MDYQVWTRDEYEEKYTKVDCGDLGAVKQEIDRAVRTGQKPILTVEVLYSMAIKIEDVGTEKPKLKVAGNKPKTIIEEEKKLEADKGKAKPGESPGAES